MAKLPDKEICGQVLPIEVGNRALQLGESMRARGP